MNIPGAALNASPRALRPAAAAGPRVLLVDDNPLQRAALRLQLEREGYRVATAENADAALRAAEQGRPDLVVSDVMMPDADGFQLCRWLRQRPALDAVPVILVSGHYGDAQDVRHAARCGANMFVSRADGAAAIVRNAARVLENPAARLDPVEGRSLDVEHDARRASQLVRLSEAHAAASRQILESRDELRAILDGIADGVFVMDGDLIVQDANPAMNRMCGYAPREARGMPLLAFVPRAEHERVVPLARELLKTGTFEGDVGLRCKDGTVRRTRVTARRVRRDLFVCMVRDVTEALRYEERLHQLAQSDALTALPNRSAFQDGLDRVARAGDAAGVLLVTLGNFREVNDTLGPDGGDQVLLEAAARLRRCAAGTEVVSARLGAAQFAVLLPRLEDAGHLERYARSVADALSAPILAHGIPVELMPCIGSARCPEDALQGNELLRRAGVAMHHARDHRAVYAAYGPQQDPFSLRQLTLMSELRQAIARDQLELWYQPKLDLATGNVDAVEALVRWRHPERGLIPPNEFIPAAERTGLVSLLTGWVLRTALRQARAWHDRGLALAVAINISQHDLREDAFPARVLAALRAHALPAGSVTLEVTETAAMHDPKRTAAALGSLRAHGVRISLDDFGTGQASLAHLHQLPVDEIKLDKSFTATLAGGRGKSIAGATAMLAREFGLESVAEGIENDECQRVLGELGFDRIQGYHVSRPLPAAELEAWLARRAAPIPETAS